MKAWGTPVPTELNLAELTELYVRVWLAEFVQLDQEQQVLALAQLREGCADCRFHRTMLGLLADLGERLARLRADEEDGL